VLAKTKRVKRDKPKRKDKLNRSTREAEVNIRTEMRRKRKGETKMEIDKYFRKV
jgi:hypothetical protein